MQIVKDPEKLKRLLEELQVRDHFGGEDLEFSLQRYEKGEFLSGPHIRQKYLLFLAEGKVRIYGIGNDARLIPVDLAERGRLIGDVEFCTGQNSNLFSEVTEEVLCIALSTEIYGEKLNRDLTFIHFLMNEVAQKVYLYSTQDSPAVSVEERLLEYLQMQDVGGEISGVEKTAMRIGCSRRQLQRALQKLCGEGRLEKVKKGCYRLQGE